MKFELIRERKLVDFKTELRNALTRFGDNVVSVQYAIDSTYTTALILYKSKSAVRDGTYPPIYL